MDYTEKFDVEGLVVKIVPDTDVESPRTDYDHAAHMVCWHRRYNLGDDHQFDSPEDFQQWAEHEHVSVILPLYLYDHSGITISTGAFNDPWDSGQVGYAYMTREDILKNWNRKRLTKRLIKQARELVEAEVKEYDQFLTGDVYGFVVEDQEGNHLDSCWGFYGFEYACQEGKDAAKYQAREIKQVQEMERNQYAM